LAAPRAVEGGGSELREREGTRWIQEVQVCQNKGKRR